jgi:DNA-binding transcriptional MerR regulator
MKQYVTTGAAAADLGISTATLTRWAAAGLVTPAERTAGGHYRWQLAALRAQVRKLNRPPTGRELAEDIASVIHDANRRLQIVQGDPRPSPLWDDAPDYQVRESTESVVQALADPDRTPEQNHQGWYDRLVADGWTLGPKDAAAKTHPDLLPFDQLPEHEQQKDRLFIAIVRALTPLGGPGDPGRLRPRSTPDPRCAPTADPRAA